jgi:hypothetical protein
MWKATQVGRRLTLTEPNVTQHLVEKKKQDVIKLAAMQTGTPIMFVTFVAKGIICRYTAY